MPILRRFILKGRYSVTSNGKVWSHFDNYRRPRSKPYLLKGDLGPAGYIRVTLQRNNRSYRYSVHRLVLETFKGKCPTGLQCGHKNGNPQDNRLVNLRWITAKENAVDRDRHRNTHRGEKNHGTKIKRKHVRPILKALSEGQPMWRVGVSYGVSDTLIWNVAHGRHWTTKTINK